MNSSSKPKHRNTPEQPLSPAATYTSINPDPLPPSPSSGSRTNVVYGAIIALFICAGAGALFYAGPEYYWQYQDQQAFRNADRADSMSAYEQYARDFPQGAYLAEVQQRIDDLRRFETADSAEELKTYLDRYPHGRRAGQVQQRLAELTDDREFQTARNTDTLEAYRDYGRRFPQGQHLSEANDAIAHKDDQAFQTAQTFDAVNAYQDYLRRFPQGRHYADANSAITGKDDQAFQTARQLNTMAAYQDYLWRFPEGRHVTELQGVMTEKQAQAKDDAAFLTAQNAHTIEAYQGYLRNFPQGRHGDDARNAIIQKDDAAFQAERSTDTIDAYQRYLRGYPNGRHVEEARSAIAQKAQGIQRQSVLSLAKPEINIINNTGYALTIEMAGETHRLETDTSRMISLPPGDYPFTGSAHGLTDTGNFQCRAKSRYTWTWTIQSHHGGSSPTLPAIPTYTPPPIPFRRL